nr:unnamed protein product [Callosobruchus chinensis]
MYPQRIDCKNSRIVAVGLCLI